MVLELEFQNVILAIFFKNSVKNYKKNLNKRGNKKEGEEKETLRQGRMVFN
jgi:hypothetical protein